MAGSGEGRDSTVPTSAGSQTGPVPLGGGSLLSLDKAFFTGETQLSDVVYLSFEL